MTLFRQFTLAVLSMLLLFAQAPVFAQDYYQQQLQNEQLLKRQLELQKKNGTRPLPQASGRKGLERLHQYDDRAA